MTVPVCSWELLVSLRFYLRQLYRFNMLQSSARSHHKTCATPSLDPDVFLHDSHRRLQVNVTANQKKKKHLPTHVLHPNSLAQKSSKHVFPCYPFWSYLVNLSTNASFAFLFWPWTSAPCLFEGEQVWFLPGTRGLHQHNAFTNHIEK